jgi:hypothetical protein
MENALIQQVFHMDHGTQVTLYSEYVPLNKAVQLYCFIFVYALASFPDVLRESGYVILSVCLASADMWYHLGVSSLLTN